LYKAELIHRRAPWKTREALELATLEWVAWFNHQRLHSAIGYIPPAEAEANYYNQLNSAEQQAVLLLPNSLRETRGGSVRQACVRSSLMTANWWVYCVDTYCTDIAQGAVMSHAPESADVERFATVREQLFTAVIGDVMDVVGLTHQFLPPDIRALVPGTMIVGRAMPVLEADCASDVSSRAQAFGLMFEALDSLKPGEIYICTGASPKYALWGGLMSTRAQALGCHGAVVDGFHRDTREILALDFPVFSSGSYAQDQRIRGRVIDYRCPILFDNGCRVEPGDLIVGDIDGVVVVPRAQEQAIIAAALQKVAGEAKVRDQILAGQSTADIYARTGIM